MWIDVLWFIFYLGMKLNTVGGLLTVCAQEKRVAVGIWEKERKKGMWTAGYGNTSAYFSFIKIINAVLVQHLFQLSLGAGPVLLLAWKNCLISPLKQQKTTEDA